MFRIHQRLSDWPECSLELHFSACGRMSVPAVKLLAQRCNNVTFAELVPRLRCQHCKARPRRSIYAPRSIGPFSAGRVLIGLSSWCRLHVPQLAR